MKKRMNERSSAASRGRGVDLLTGTPWQKIALFAVPMIIGNLFQQLYNTVDSIIVGRWVGHIGLAAVGVSSPMLFLLVAVFMGVATGSSVCVAQYYGAKNEKALRRTLHTSIMLAIVVGIALSIIGYILSPTFLRLLNTPEETYAYALQYMQILFLGLAAQMLYNMTSGFMRGMGNSRTPLFILIFTCVTNTLLDLFFVINMNLGVAGAAWATIISQCLSSVLAVTALHRTNELTRISRSELRINWDSAKEIIGIGFPTAIQQGVISLGGVIIQGFVNSYGTAMIAGHNAAMKVDMFAVMPIMSFSMAMVSYTGQNVGAGNMDRVHKGVKQGATMSVMVVATFSSILFFFGRYVLMLFTDDAATVEAGYMIIRTLAPFYWMFAINQTLGGVMRGSGETVSPMINALLMNIFVRIPLVFFLDSILKGPQAIYYSQIGGWVFGVSQMLFMYSRGKWERKALSRIEMMHANPDANPRANQSQKNVLVENP